MMTKIWKMMMLRVTVGNGAFEVDEVFHGWRGG